MKLKWGVGVLIIFAMAGCSQPTKKMTELEAIDDKHIVVSDPGGPTMGVTGIGCGVTEREALNRARKIAHFNLRGVAGPNLKKVDYTGIREINAEGEFCVEVVAQRGN